MSDEIGVSIAEENRALQAKLAAVENAIRNEPELPGEIPQEMFETIKTLDKQGIEEWCRIIVRKTKESILRNAEPTETKAAR